jgi:hypothetical protein
MVPAWSARNSEFWSPKIELTSVSSAGPEAYQGSLGAEAAWASWTDGRWLVDRAPGRPAREKTTAKISVSLIIDMSFNFFQRGLRGFSLKRLSLKRSLRRFHGTSRARLGYLWNTLRFYMFTTVFLAG